jgi:diguanylate cyclase (GGDEF)-like protein/PAS domain S-box-containing protein
MKLEKFMEDNAEKNAQRGNTELAALREQRIIDLQRQLDLQKEIGELNSRLAAIVESSDDAIIGKDLNGIITSWNKGAERIYGYAAEEVVGRPISILVPSSNAEEIPSILEKIRRGERVEHYETIRVTKAAEQIFISLTASPIRDAAGTIIGASTISRDITRRRKYEEMIQRQARILDQIQESVITTDLDGKVIGWNKGAERIFLYTAEEALGRHISFIYPEDQLEFLEHDVIEPLKEKGVHESEARLRRKSGEEFHALLLLTMLRNGNGVVTGMVGSSVDITAQKQMEKKLYEAANTDILTGLYNRRGFMTLAEHQLRVADREKRNLILVYVDLNDMKRINDKFGHEEGDRALADTANLLRKSFRESDILGRLGGDEFAVLLTQPSERDIKQVICEHIQENLKSLNKQGGRHYLLSVSVGIAHYDPAKPSTLSDLLTTADKLMYREKGRHKREGEM